MRRLGSVNYGDPWVGAMSDLSAADAGGMNHWMSRTATVLATFPTWSAGVRCLDLTEELGELARAILMRKAASRPPRGRNPSLRLFVVCCSMSSLLPSTTGLT